MLTFLKKIFTWWNRDTFGTRLKTILFGKFVGKDSNGNNFSARYVQVCTSILGIHALFVLIQGTLIALFTNSDTISADAIPSDVAIIFLLVSLYAWFVNGHIFKNALDTSMIIGLGVSLLHGIAIIFVTLILIQIFA